jgi:TorA maturation chaperone TorD
MDFYTGDWQQIFTGELLFFSLLSRIFNTYPDIEARRWMTPLIDEDAFMEVPFAENQEDVKQGIEILHHWGKNGLTDELFEKIRSDYMRLFIGPGKVLAPPWESVYFSEERLLFQEQTLQIRQWFHRFGLEAEKKYKEPDDHIGLEMSFVAYLSKLALQAFEEQDQEKFDELLEAQHEFLAEHLLAWGYQWCNRVIEYAQTDFYKGLAFLTQGALTALAEQFSIQPSREAVK